MRRHRRPTRRSPPLRRSRRTSPARSQDCTSRWHSRHPSGKRAPEDIPGTCCRHSRSKASRHRSSPNRRTSGRRRGSRCRRGWHSRVEDRSRSRRDTDRIRRRSRRRSRHRSSRRRSTSGRHRRHRLRTRTAPPSLQCRGFLRASVVSRASRCSGVGFVTRRHGEPVRSPAPAARESRGGARFVPSAARAAPRPRPEAGTRARPASRATRGAPPPPSPRPRSW